jgi:hypothetical protein
MADGKPKNERERNIVADGAKKLCDLITTMLQWEQVAELESLRPYPNAEDRTTAYWRTLCTNFTPEGDEMAAKEYERWRWDIHKPGTAELIELVRTQLIEGSVVDEALYLLRTGGIFQYLFWQMSKWTVGRRFGMTEKGYFSLVSDQAQVGDSIALCMGGDFPLVVRRRGECWELIGDSYVHGIMDGEGFRADLCDVMDFV